MWSLPYGQLYAKREPATYTDGPAGASARIPSERSEWGARTPSPPTARPRTGRANDDGDDQGQHQRNLQQADMAQGVRLQPHVQERRPAKSAPPQPATSLAVRGAPSAGQLRGAGGDAHLGLPLPRSRLRLPAAALPTVAPAAAGADFAVSSWTASPPSASYGAAAAAPYVVLIVVCRFARRGGDGSEENRRPRLGDVRVLGRWCGRSTRAKKRL